MSQLHLHRAEALDDDDHRVWLCREDLGPLGSFKWRGADAHCRRLAEQGEQGVVAASTGNFAAAVAWAAGRHGLTAHVAVPERASAAKLERLDALGALVHRAGATLSDAATAAQKLARELGLPYFEDGGSAWQLEGTATLGAELADAGGSGAVVVPVACGALAAGVAMGLRETGAQTPVVGVQVRACSRLAARWHGRPDPPSRPAETIADGLADDRIVEPAFGACRRLLADVLVVDEDDVRNAMRALHRVMGTLPEGAGSTALAGLRRFPSDVPAGDVVVVVSGANVAADLAADVLDS